MCSDAIATQRDIITLQPSLLNECQSCVYIVLLLNCCSKYARAHQSHRSVWFTSSPAVVAVVAVFICSVCFRRSPNWYIPSAGGGVDDARPYMYICARVPHTHSVCVCVCFDVVRHSKELLLDCTIACCRCTNNAKQAERSESLF